MILSIRELQLQEEVARLRRRVYELESTGPFTIDEAALDLSTVHDSGGYPLLPHIEVVARRYHGPESDSAENYQVIWSCHRDNSAWEICYKADRAEYTRGAEERIYEHLLAQALSHIVHRS